MGAGREGEFSVTVSRKEVVAAVLPLLGHRLPLSNLDLLLPPLDVGVFFCYNKPIISFFGPLGADNINTNNDTISFGSVARVLKRAMAQVLVYYYPFAGEVVANSVGEPELLCNNRGVDVFEAFADIELKDLNLYNPDQSIEGKLVPQKKAGVLAVQITELKCGGLVVACAFDHRIADAYSANMFLVSWAEMAESKSISVVPCFRRSLLSPRRPAGHIDPLVDNLYVPISCMPPPPRPTTPEDPHHHQANAADDNSLISRIYYIKSDDLNRLQSLASFNKERKRSKLESLSAFLWQMVAKYADISSEDDASKTATSKLGIVVDGRNRLSSDDDENVAVDRATLMAAYFGNVLSIPYGTKRVDQLIENPLSWVAEEVHAFLQNAVTKDHFLSLIDWVEARRPEPAVTKIYCSEINDGPALVVSSGRSFPVSKVNFGWGAPLFGSYHFPWGGNTGYVMPMPSPAGNGDWIVYMHLFRGQLDFFETEAVDLFRPLTYDYLSLN